MNYGIRNSRIGQFALDQRSLTASISPAGRNCILNEQIGQRIANKIESRQVDPYIRRARTICQ